MFGGAIRGAASASCSVRFGASTRAHDNTAELCFRSASPTPGAQRAASLVQGPRERDGDPCVLLARLRVSVSILRVER